MSAAERTLRIVYATPEQFAHDFQSNLSNGGVFIETEESFGLREAVRVEIDLPYAGRQVGLPGEIVHIVPPEIRDAGGVPGAAVQFTEPAVKIRDHLAELLVATGAPPPPQSDSGGGQRGSRRAPARVAARIDDGADVLDGRTRNLSKTGVLVAVHGQAAPIGERVALTLRHPMTGEERGVEGHVVRQIETGSGVSAVAIQFSPGEDQKGELEQFITDIQRVEHTRGLGGIAGPIAELGPQSLVQMFAMSAPVGTLYLRRGDEEGLIGFEKGLLRYACLGSATGMKALLRMLTWCDGDFEFHARLEDVPMIEAPLPLEAALLEALRQVDESTLVDHGRFDLDSMPTVREAAVGSCGTLSKVEEAILDLARAGFTVKRMLEVIPEPDPEIFKALESLGDQEVIGLPN